MGFKYIVLEIKQENIKREWPIIFPDMMVHKQVAEYNIALLRREHDFKPVVIAAGLVSFFGGDVTCSGESETLNIESRGKEDEKLIRMFDYLHGIV